jgi:hypothetical protein
MAVELIVSFSLSQRSTNDGSFEFLLRVVIKCPDVSKKPSNTQHLRETESQKKKIN